MKRDIQRRFGLFLVELAASLVGAPPPADQITDNRLIANWLSDYFTTSTLKCNYDPSFHSNSDY